MRQDFNGSPVPGSLVGRPGCTCFYDSANKHKLLEHDDACKVHGKGGKGVADPITRFVREMLTEEMPLDLLGSGLVANACRIALIDHADKDKLIALVEFAWDNLVRLALSKRGVH